MALSIEIIVLLTITGICSVIFACVTRAAAPLFFCVLLFASSISAPIENGIIGDLTWIGPLQMRRSELFLGASLLLLLNLLVLPRKLQPARAPANALCMLAVGLLMGLMQAAQGDPIEGILTASLASISLGATIMYFTQMPDFRTGYRHFAGCIVAVNCFIIAVMAVQMLRNPDAMLSSEWSRRFQGLTGNPQFLGAQFAIATTVALWLLLNSSRKLLLTMLVFLIGLNCLFIAWTGSRTGLGMAVIGVSIVMFSRFKRAAIGLPLAAVGVAIAYKLFGSVLTDIDTSRLTSLRNTRGGVWGRLFEVYQQSPLIGVGFGTGELDKSENSFLYGMAAYGTGMGLLYLIAAIATAMLITKLVALRRLADAGQRGMIDLVIAVNAAFFAGTVFEGYFIGRVNVLVIFFVSTNVIGFQLLRQMQARPHAAVAPLRSGDDPVAPAERDDDDLNYAELTPAYG